MGCSHRHSPIFLGVTVADALYQLHRTCYQHYAEYFEGNTLFRPETWIPHCTLADGLAVNQLSSTIDICQTYPLPIKAIANRIALVDSDPIEIIDEVYF